MIENICQISIFVLGAIAMWLVARKDEYKKYGYIFGLVSQPIWFYVTLGKQQYGMFALSIFYTYCWALGIYNYWFKK